ncbi:uncharacterized protein LOC126888690 [Diabrotica virgifera virgifera]|uniref:Reverse transcriptase domain-containing protein n=1 Tax=Diabrotica virgifera virgifera TaxID=50390 RepID=A0ABM5KS49_DIAVI|nr:uncharacterized protein LOC126888690 [Diabrotica virgifera virgifera]
MYYYNTNTFPLEKGIRQGDTISGKLFTALLQSAMRNNNWEHIGVNINGEFLKLRFPDQIVLIANQVDDLTSQLLQDLHSSYTRVGLKINLYKTQNLLLVKNILTNSSQIEQVYTYKDLGHYCHEIKLGTDNQTIESIQRIGRTNMGILRKPEGSP